MRRRVEAAISKLSQSALFGLLFGLPSHHPAILTCANNRLPFFHIYPLAVVSSHAWYTTIMPSVNPHSSPRPSNQKPKATTQTHIVSLVLQSKKALESGQQLCARAGTVSDASAHVATAVIGLNAKIAWACAGIREQLKVITARDTWRLVNEWVHSWQVS